MNDGKVGRRVAAEVHHLRAKLMVTRNPEHRESLKAELKIARRIIELKAQWKAAKPSE